MGECITNISIPQLPIDPCNGKKYDTKCVVNTEAFSLLGLPVNSGLDVILKTLETTLSVMKLEIELLNDKVADLESKVLVLESYHP